jgi:hypothetical protein
MVAFDGKPAEIDERRFREIYGEDAIEVEIGPVPTQGMSAEEAAMRAEHTGDDFGRGLGPPPDYRV